MKQKLFCDTQRQASPARGPTPRPSASPEPVCRDAASPSRISITDARRLRPRLILPSGLRSTRPLLRACSWLSQHRMNAMRLTITKSTIYTMWGDINHFEISSRTPASVQIVCAQVNATSYCFIVAISYFVEILSVGFEPSPLPKLQQQRVTGRVRSASIDVHTPQLQLPRAVLIIAHHYTTCNHCPITAYMQPLPNNRRSLTCQLPPDKTDEADEARRN